MAQENDGHARFFDSHAHLGDQAFDGDRDAVVQSARLAGVEGIVCIGSVLDANDAAERICKENTGFVYWTTGVHPHEASAFDAVRDIPLIRAAISRGAVAIGECGLDHHYENSPRETQRAAFEAQISVAAETGRPLVVHTRDAEDVTSAMIRSAAGQGVSGVLHCFTGSTSLAAAALEAGWYISFSGIVTFRAWKNDDVIRLVPDDRILAESDSPYLAPVPNRGKRNEPSWVAKTVERLAAVRGTPVDEVGRATVENAHRFFGLVRSESRATSLQ